MKKTLTGPKTKGKLNKMKMQYKAKRLKCYRILLVIVLTVASDDKRKHSKKKNRRQFDVISLTTRYFH